jgi:hypothetical protein
MKTTVKSIANGKVFKVDENIKSFVGECWSSIIISGIGKVETNWWIRNGKVTASVHDHEKGVKGKFELEQASDRMQKWIDTQIKHRNEEKKHTEMCKRSQMYNY